MLRANGRETEREIEGGKREGDDAVGTATCSHKNLSSFSASFSGFKLV